MALKATTRDQIVATAINELSSNPACSLEAIILASEVPRATFFRYFKDREDLELFVESICFECLSQGLKPAKNFEETLRILLDHAPLARYVFLRRELNASSDRDPVTAKLEEVMTPLWETGAIDESIPMSWIDEVIGSLIFAGWNLARSGKLSHDELVNLTSRTLLRGLGR